MKILILNWRCPKHPLAGGAEISLEKNALYWFERGFEITWFASTFNKSKKEEKYKGITIVRKGSHYTVFAWFFLSWIFGKFRDNDIIIDSFHFFPFFTPLFIKNKLIISLINEVAGDVWFDNLPLPLAFIGYRLEPYIIKFYRKIHFITGSLSTAADLQKLGIRKQNIKIINHGFTPLPITKKFKKEKKPTLLFLGRLSKDKGIEDALLMLELLIRDNSDITLWIAGKFESDKYEKRLRRLINEFKVKNNCNFFGYVSEEKKAELLQRVWVLVHPSVKEGWGLNVIEANSIGTPAVGYNVAGLRDSIINNKTGLLVDPDALSLADGIEDLIDDKKSLQLFSQEAKKWAKTFSWEIAGEESFRYINSLYVKYMSAS